MLIFMLLIFCLFFIGLMGLTFIRRNMLIVLMSIELLLLAINLNFVIFSCYSDDVLGQIFSFFILTVAACESAIGLSLLIIFFRNKAIISVDHINILKG
jgi:NADH-quinone oxidoreductase subunit K